jgi:hypothetical protein
VIVGVVGVLLVAGQAAAQVRGAVGEPSGVRDSARLLDRVDIVAAPAVAPGVPVPKFALLFLPSYTSVEGARVGGGTFGLVAKSLPRPVQVRVNYRRIDLKEAESRDQFGVDAKSTIVSEGATRVAVLGEFRKTVDISRKVKLGAALEHTLWEKVTFGGGLDYVRATPVGAEGTGDVAPAVGFSYAWANKLETSFDYAFENDVDGDDDYSFTVSHQIADASQNGRRGAAVLVFGAGKGRTVFGTLVLSFNR